MKRFLKKKWHRIPLGIVAVVLALVLVAGSAFAGYGFLKSTLNVEVVEAVAIGMWPAWDNLEPYGSVDDVDITIEGTVEAPTITISTAAETPYVGEGFTAGEWIVLPVNIRNGSDGSLNLSASVTTVTKPSGGNIALEYIWQTNPGPTTTTESGQDMRREFKASGTWAPLSGWSATIAGHGGKSGSAVVGAKVLFVKISAPGDVVPGTYIFEVTLSRS